MRKSLHISILAILAAACLLTSCKKNTEGNGASFTAETEQGDPNDAKTELVGSDIRWKTGDQIWLKNNDGQKEQLTVADGIGSNKGKFYSSSSFNLNPPYTASYGVNIDNGAVSLPATQTLTAAQVASPGTIADGIMPMVATSTTNKLPFKNLLGGLCFKVTGSGALTAIRITSSNTSEKLWGDFTANFADGTMTPTTGGAGSNVLTVNCTNITLSSTVQYFIVMLPPGALTSGYTVDFLNANTVVKTINATGNASLIQRSKIKTSSSTTNVVPVVQYTVTATTNNASWGTVTGGGIYNQNATCTLTATPASGYVFENWTIGGVVQSSYVRSHTITVTSNVTIQANFVQVPANAIPGLFNVGGRIVWFAKGNVKYTGSAWQFHTNQYDRVGNTNQYTTENNVARDVFAWSMNGQKHKGNDYTIYMPYQYGYAALHDQYSWGSTWNAWYPNACFAYQPGSGSSDYDLNSSTGQADWGYNFGDSWRTPTSTEWSNLLSNHSTKRWCTVNSVPGYAIRPLGNTEALEASYSAAAWVTEQDKGTLFLPAVGIRELCDGNWYGSSTSDLRYSGGATRATNYGSYGYYWSATHGTINWYNARYMYFYNNTITTGETLRNHGCSVRLIKNR